MQEELTGAPRGTLERIVIDARDLELGAANKKDHWSQEQDGVSMKTRNSRPLILPLALLSLLSLFPCLGAPVWADACAVPGDHGSVQEAVDDLTCTFITLGPQSFVESVSISRDLSLQGVASATIEGRVTIEGPTTDVVLSDLGIDASGPLLAGCFPEAISVRGGAKVEGRNLAVRNRAAGACGVNEEIFSDGFESGDTRRWSGHVP
jgi:hypothetical protein